MQDLDDDPRVGRRRLSAIQGERGTPTVTTQDASVVSAQRLLKVATVAVRVTALVEPALGVPTVAYARPPPVSATAASTTLAAVHFVTRMCILAVRRVRFGSRQLSALQDRPELQDRPSGEAVRLL